MKRILAFFTILALALSCGKENETNGGGGGGSKEVESVTIESASTIRISIENEAGRLLPVTVSPAGCTLNQVKVVVEKEGIIACSLGDGGVRVRPLSIGETKLTVAPKEGPGSAASVTVKVLSAEDYATLEISNIAMESTVTLREGESSIAAVTLTPAEATTDMLKWSGGEEYVTVSAVEGGLQFVPKKVGNTTVKVEAKKGTAAAKTVTVEILDKNAYSDYVIQDIKYSPSTVEVKDNGTTDITLTLDPEAATVTDLSVSSSDNTIAEVTKMGGKVLRITGKKAGNTKITVKGLRSGSKSIQIPVTVYGHVTKIDLSRSDSVNKLSSSDIIELILNNTDRSVKLVAECVTSGQTNGTPAVTWVVTTGKGSDGDKLVTVESNGTVTAQMAGGSANQARVTAWADNVSASVLFMTYDPPKSVEIDTPMGAAVQEKGTGQYQSYDVWNLRNGSSCSLRWRILPSTAKQDATLTLTAGSVDKSSVLSTAKNGSDHVTTIKPDFASKEMFTFRIFAVNGNVSSNRLFYFNQYNPNDVKPGDCVYYNSSDSRFYWSDGGVRCMTSKDNYRSHAKSKQTGLGEYIGRVYSPDVPEIDAAFNKLTKLGFKNSPVSGKHACVLSAYMAKQKGDKVDYWRWCETNENVYAQSDWNNGPYPVDPKAGVDYSFKLNIIYYDKKSGGSHDIKPGYVVASFDKVTFGDFGDETQYTTYSSLSHTGWMLPMRETVYNMRGPGLYTKLFPDFDDYLEDYWTADQYGNDEAWYWYFDKINDKIVLGHKAKDPQYNSDKPYIRPILWL